MSGTSYKERADALARQREAARLVADHNGDVLAEAKAFRMSLSKAGGAVLRLRALVDEERERHPELTDEQAQATVLKTAEGKGLHRVVRSEGLDGTNAYAKVFPR